MQAEAQVVTDKTSFSRDKNYFENYRNGMTGALKSRDLTRRHQIKQHD